VEVNAKVKELEDEVKVLKAEIRNVLLDIREAILENTNPLTEQEPAYLRMDLTTTARTVAAEEATRAARDAIDQAKAKEPKAEEPKAEEPKAEEPKAEEPEAEEPKAEEPEAEEPEEDAAEQAEDQEPTEDKLEEPEPGGDGDLSSNGKASRKRKGKDKALPDAPLGAAGLPPMQLAYLLPTGAMGGLAAWVAEAMATIGPQDLERVITIHRLWGSIPPNISYALAHLQRLIRSSQQKDPPWLKIMQDMEKLASS
jgi:flagellar biosynthesis GTPase FlhF